MRISLSIVIQVWRRVYASSNCISQQHDFTFSHPAQAKTRPWLSHIIDACSSLRKGEKKAYNLLTWGKFRPHHHKWQHGRCKRPRLLHPPGWDSRSSGNRAWLHKTGTEPDASSHRPWNWDSWRPQRQQAGESSVMGIPLKGDFNCLLTGNDWLDWGEPCNPLGDQSSDFFFGDI